VGTSILQECTASVFRIEVDLKDGEVFTLKHWYQPARLHSVIMVKATACIFTTMKISNLPQLFKME
jgi:hypothetical protein